jgi:hypothetical protein
MCLNDISSMNNFEIESEYKRIKENSGCEEWFDNLIKASFKSYVLFLTWNPKTSSSKYIDNAFYNQISLKDFIHKCYIETCIFFHTNPEIFLKKGAKNEIYEIIKNCIEIGIKKTLPYDEIIQEYLKINFDVENKDVNRTEINNIKTMVSQMMAQHKYGGGPVGKALITESSSYNNFNENEDINEDINEDVKHFINVENNNQLPNEFQMTKNDQIVEYNSENKDIFIPLSLTGSKNGSKHSSKHNSVKIMSDTSDDFSLQHSVNKKVDIQQPLVTATSTQAITRTEAKKKELQLTLNNAQLKTSDVVKNNEELQLTGGHKQKIQIVKNKSNSLHDKIDTASGFFDSLLNN